MFLSVAVFVGHFHPVLVHLPIGILLMAAVLYALSLQERYQSLQQAAGISLLLGMISAVGSCVSGYLLSISGDYESELVRTHQWMGIGVAVISILCYGMYIKQNHLLKWMMACMAILIFLTGHSGGSLTHGSEYLLTSWSKADTKSVRQPIVNVQEALLYKDLVQPLLEEKCYGCHNAQKQKGQLRLDGSDWIMKGGKEGAVVNAGNADGSELFKRLLLPRHEEKHMPPKEKPQLTEKEVALLHWWIQAGLTFDKKVSDIPQSEQIKKILAGLQTAPIQELTDNSWVPKEAVDPADASVIKKLTDRGVVILPVAQNSHYLTANFITVVELKDSDIQLLGQLSKQLIWLKLAGQPVVDDMMKSLSRCEAITRLDLSNTKITDKGLPSLQPLQQLRTLNLTGTAVTENGLLNLKYHKMLQTIYAYRSAVRKNAFVTLKAAFPKVNIDTGGYIIRALPNDTVIVAGKKY